MTDASDEKTQLLHYVDKGNRAEMLMVELKDVMKAIKQEAFDTWLLSEGADTQGRENLHHRAVAVDHVEQELIRRINNGAAAKAVLQKLPDEDDHNA